MNRTDLPKSNYVEITVLGHVSPEWSDYLSGLDIDTSFMDGTPVTKLNGIVPDQAALFGILNGLYGLGYSLQSVQVAA